MSFAPLYKKRSRFALSVFALLSSTAPVFANPEGGVVAAGAADITTTGSTLNINQYSDRAVIDWRSFNVSPSELTQFHQPSTGSIAVNRVNDANPSQILGSLKANGNVVIINPSGVMFGRDSKVDVGGLIATTLDVRNDEVMAGGALKFTKANGVTGKIVNEGQITAREAGLVGLVADSVENSGVIEARMGHVVLASGDVASIDFQGDGLLSLEVTDDNAKRFIKHSGKIDAAGGNVLLTAAAGRNIVDNLIEVSGEIKTPTIGKRNGRIVISAAGINRTTRTGKASRVTVSGTLSAQGQMAGETGGGIQVLADEVEIKNTARVLADGSAGGGSINIGGSFQGGREDADYNLLKVRRPELEGLQSAQTVVVEKGAEINASATDDGNGGDIVLWADRAMYFYGTNYARGGANSGNGGFVETSGKHYLDYNGLTDTRAANGKAGLLLLDPTNITISNAASQNVGTDYFFYSPTADDVTSILNIGTLAVQLGNGDVSVQTRASGSQLGDINVNADLNAFGYYDGGSTLFLSADHDINVNANMILYGGSYYFTAAHDINVNNQLLADYTTLNAQNNVILNADVVSNVLYTKVGNDIIVNSDISAVTTYIDTYVANRSVSLGNNTGGINLDSAELAYFQNKNFRVGQNSSVGNIAVAGTSPWGSLYLKSTTGAITTIGNQTIAGGVLDLKTDSLDLGGTISGASSVEISTLTNGTSIGLGDGTGGTIHLSSADLTAMSGANTYTFGNAAVSAPITVAANHWTGDLNLRTTNSSVNITGNQTVASGKDMTISSGTGSTVNINGNISGGRNLTVVSDSLQLDGDVSGTGTITISSSNSAVDVGVGTGAAGGLQLDDTELSHIKDGWGGITINSAKDLTINAYNWLDSLSSTAKNITINGDQNMGANNLTLKASAGDIAVNAALAGSGVLTLQNGAFSGVANIANATGTFNLSTTELDRIQDGWSQIVVGGTSSGAVNISAYTWRDPVKFTAPNATMTFSGVQNFGSNNVELSSNRLFDLNANLIGTGQLTLSTVFTTTKMTIGSTTDTAASRISAADITSFLLGKGWSSFVIGASTQTSTIAVTGANNWNADLAIKTKGAITINTVSAQDVGAHNLTIETDATPLIGSNLSGTGIFNFKPISGTRSIGLAGATGQNITLSTTTLGRIVNGWSKQVYGMSNQTGNISIGANTWSDPTHFLTNNGVYINGNQTSGDTSSDPTKLVFAAGTNFWNNGYTIDAGTGRYLVYSNTPSLDAYGGLSRTTKRYGKNYASYAPASVTETGNVFLYSDTPSLDVTIDNATREYGGADPSFTYAIDASGLIDGDSLSDALITSTLTTTATATTNVGTADILGNFLSTMGYQFNVTNGTLSITKATLTATADNQTREYGLSNPTLSVSYTGFRNGDTASVIDTAATASTAATILSNVGSYGITASGAVDNNYAFNYVVGNLSVTKATLTATADDKTREYGLSNPALTVSYVGFRNGDNASMIDTEATAGTTANTFSNVGSYGVVASGAVDNNYTFNYVGGHLTVTPKSLLVSVPSQAIRSMGTPLPYIATYSGFVNGDTDSLITRAASVRDTAGNYITPGTYQIIPFDALIGSANYSLVYAPSDLTISSVVPDSVSRTMNVPPSISAQNNIWQNVSTNAGFFSERLNSNGSYFLKDQDGNIHFSENSVNKGNILSPVSELSIQVESDLASLLRL